MRALIVAEECPIFVVVVCAESRQSKWVALVCVPVRYYGTYKVLVLEVPVLKEVGDRYWYGLGN